MEKKSYHVRNVIIGVGKPKIIVPIVGKTKAQIIDKANEFDYDMIDLVEWRADFYEDVYQVDAVLDTLIELRMVLKDTPLIFTFRTDREGGEKAIEMPAYVALNTAVAKSAMADIIDVEIFSGDDIVKQSIDNIHEAGCLVIASNHDFHKTPSEEELIKRMLKMQSMNADIPKIAMMPQSKADVLTLLSATSRMYEEFADRPIITMSMSSKGVISRLTGEVFGSAMTFGAVGQVSAPGQIPVESLSEVLDILTKAI
ncbi:type I 3-dehydroquinate dehydratase [Fusibacter paucivorans]|uniref:3-dehydroquinate dehydratase n=1 Tax=Fusibacter paucivorans TaxID=76009 RepID=A0ABS5PU38_9FIRM|nr:type I 3-dehydroquinate dehydratase [Fusibacter paucivorans]MBS7528690.1 type I 3-dehydroquinate dehydratase [Fusibacter paucivorans]